MRNQVRRNGHINWEEEEEPEIIIDSTGQQMGAHNPMEEQGDYLDVLHEQPNDNIDFFDNPNEPSEPENMKIIIPYNQVLSAEDGSFREGVKGLEIEAAFQLLGEDNQVLFLKMTNNTGQELTDLMLKFQANSYSLQPVSQELSVSTLPSNGNEVEIKVPLDMKGNANGQPPDCPIKLKVALNTQVDIFVFEVLCSFTIFIRKFSKNVNEDSFRSFIMNEKAIKTKDSIACDDTNVFISEIDSLINKLDHNNIGLVFRQSKPGGEMLNCMTETVDGLPIAIQIYLAADSDQILINYVVVDEALVQLVFQAIQFIIKL
jgi:hypothetical protein